MIDILIPTYNRANELNKNFQLLNAEIKRFQLESRINIIISNNSSEDETSKVVTSFIKKNKKLRIEYFEQQENIGLEKNAVFILSKAFSEYFMFLGDDDFLPYGYLNFCDQTTSRTKLVGCIIPGVSNLYKDGSIRIGRIEDFETKKFTKGYKSLIKYSHYGSQLSGILMKKGNLLEEYLTNQDFRNIYLFIFFLSKSIYSFDGIYAPKYKILVSMDNEKNWAYNNIGLLDEVFKSYYPFCKLLGESKVSDLMIKFIMMQSFRLDFKKNIFTNYYSIVKSTVKVKSFNYKLFYLLLKEYILLQLNIFRKR